MTSNTRAKRIMLSRSAYATFLRWRAVNQVVQRFESPRTAARGRGRFASRESTLHASPVCHGEGVARVRPEDSSRRR